MNINFNILSMTKSVKRREFMRFKLSEASINNYNFFDAIDGHDLQEEYAKYIEHCNNKNQTILNGDIGAYGCLMSHKKFFQNINDSEPQILLEDDVYFHKDFHQLFPKVNNIIDDYDLIYLGYNNYHLSPEQKMAINFKDFLIPLGTKKPFITCGTFAILYNVKAIQYFNDLFTNLRKKHIQPVDVIIWLHASKHLKSIILNPPLCIAELRGSEIRNGDRDMKTFYDKRFIDINEYVSVDKYEKFR